MKSRVISDENIWSILTTHLPILKSEIESLIDKIVKGLELVYEKLIEFKKEKNSELVVIKGDKIVRIRPEQL